MGVTGQEGSTKHQVSNIIDEHSVATESGLLLRQEVESILVWKLQWSTINRYVLQRNHTFLFHFMGTSLVLVSSWSRKKHTFKVKTHHQAEEARLDRKIKVTLETFSLKRSWKYWQKHQFNTSVRRNALMSGYIRIIIWQHDANSNKKKWPKIN